MATRKEILSDLNSKIADGNISEAYRSFEELPVVDQIAVSIAPGVGDVLAAYEVKEFGSRAQTNIEDKDYLGAAGNTGLQVLSGISLIPLFRFLRGAKAVAKSGAKALDVPSPKPNPIAEPLQLAPPKELPQIELPEVQPFNVKPAKDLAYQTTKDYLPLQSKTRKFLHGHYKKIDPKINELSPEDWVKTLTNPNNQIPLGELRILNVLDELNEIHPKFAKAVAEQPDQKISKQGLDNYLSRQQVDALQIRNAPPGQLQSADTSFVNNDLKNTQQQKLYHVRGAGEQRTRDIHYSNLVFADEVNGMNITGKNAYVFDGTGITNPMRRYEAREGNLFNEGGTEVSGYIRGALDDLGIEPTDNFASIFRVQSDFMNEVSGSNGFFNPKKQKEITKKLLRYNKLVDELNPILVRNPNPDTSRELIDNVLEDVYSLSDGLQFKLQPKDLEKITGKPFTESLDKSLKEIYYTVDPATGGQKYFSAGPNPIDRAAAYFTEGTMGIRGQELLKNGVRILKKAIIPDPDFANKFKIDPYFEKTTSNEMKLPVRANVLEAFKAGKEGIHIGPAQASMEGGGTNILEKYTRGEKEIQKILDELGLGNKKKQLTTRIEGTNTEFDGTYLKFTDELKKAIEEQGINAFKDGGFVDIDNSSEAKTELEYRLNAGESIEDIIKDLVKKEYKTGIGFNKTRKGFIDTLESDIDKKFDFKFKDELVDILQSDDPKANIENRLRNRSTDTINNMLSDLDMPIGIRRDNYGTSFDKTFDINPNTSLSFDAYKPDEGDARGDINFNYSNQGKYGNLDIQSSIDDMGDTDNQVDYGFNKGPISIEAQKRPGRDATGSVAYNVSNIPVGNAQNVSIKAVVNQLMNAKANIDYMYNNPNTGGYFNAGIGFNSKQGPEIGINFGRNF